MVKYSYSLSSDFGGNLEEKQFHKNLADHGDLGSKFDGIEIDQDNIDIHFNTSLTAGEQTTLNSLVSGHAPAVSTADVSNVHYEFMEIKTEISTTQKSYVRANRLTTKHLLAGYYKLEWYYEWASPSLNPSLNCQIQLDDTTTVHSQQSAASIGDGTKFTSATGFTVVNLTEGTHDIDIDFQSIEVEVSIKNIRLFLFRL